MNLPDDGYILLESIIPPDECSSYISLLNNHAAAAAANTTFDSNTATATDGNLTTGDSKNNASSEPRHHKAKTHADPSDKSRPHKMQAVALAVPQVLILFCNKHILSKARKALSITENGSYADDDKNNSQHNAEEIVVEHLDVIGTKYYPMLPGGTSVHWNQDAYYFGTGGYDPVCITCAIYLEQTTKENGCLRLIPKSQDPTWNGHEKRSDNTTYKRYLHDNGHMVIG